MPPIYVGDTLVSKMYVGATAVDALFNQNESLLYTYPVPSNNKIAMVGDSRTSNSSFFSGEQYTNRLQMIGYGPFLLAECGYRVEISEIYAVAGQDLWYNRDQLTAMPGGGVYKGNVLSGGTGTLTDPYPTTAGTILFLAGVNGVNGSHSGYLGSQEPWTRSGKGTDWLYAEMLSAFDTANKCVILCNELPNSGDNGSGTAQLERRQKLMDYTPPSSKMVKVNTFDQVASSPGVNTYKTGLVKAGENVHGNIRCSRVLGKYLGGIINSMFKDFPVRNQLPISNAQTGWIFSNIMTITPYAPGGGITGNVAGSMNASANLSGTIVCESTVSVDTDGYSQTVYHIYGTGVAAANAYGVAKLEKTGGGIMNFGSAASPIAVNGIHTYDNDRLFSIAEIHVEAGSVGLIGVNLNMFISCSGVGGFTNMTAASHEAPTMSNYLYAEDFGTDAFSATLMSQPVICPVGWSSGAATSRIASGGIGIQYRTDRAIDITVRMKRFGFVKNR